MKDDLIKKEKPNSIKTSFFNYRNRMSKFVMDLIDSNNPIHVLNEKYIEYEAYRLGITLKEIKDNNYIRYITDYSDELCVLAEDMAKIYREMLATVFEDDSFSLDLGNRIESITIKPNVCWDSKGKTGCRLDGKFIKIKSEDSKYTFIKLSVDSAKVLFYLSTIAFIDAFDTFLYKTPSGYNYFGKCERCGKYYSKARSSQKFCGIKCKNAAGQTVHRNEIKNQPQK